MSNNDDLTKMLTLFEGKESTKKKAEPKEKIDEFKMKPTPKSKKGMFKGKSKEELRAMAAATKKKMKSHEDKGEKVPEALRSKMAEINFALRAKNDWGKAESTEKKPAKDKKVVKEEVETDIEFKQLKAYITENFWGGSDSSSDTPEDSEEDNEEGSGSGEEEPHYDGGNNSDEGDEKPDDVLKMDVPVFIKFLEFARENSKSDDDLHELAEKMISCSEGGEKTLTMADYEECCGNCEDGDRDSNFGDKKPTPPAFGRENQGSGSDEGDGYDRSVQAEGIRNIMNKLGMIL